MKKRIAAFTLALAIVMATTLTGCKDFAAVIGLPPFPTPPPDMLTTDRVDPSPGPTLSAEPSDEPTPSAGPSEALLSPTPKPGPSAAVALITDEHISYISATGPGLFSPKGYITRKEAAVILYRLLADTVPVTVSYTDISDSSWYADAARQLGSLGVIRPNESAFNGSDVITRGEFASYLACFFPMRTDAEQFPDVLPDHPYASAILSGQAWGWLTPLSDGTFDPDGALRRCEAVTIINRALGRTGDQESIAENRPALFLDVPATEWYYNDVMEAAVPHTHTVGEDGTENWTGFTQVDTGLPKDFRTEGYHLYQGWSYYYSEKSKDIVRNGTVSGSTFDADGHFTTGDTWVDKQLREIVLSQTKSGQTRAEMRKAFFAYCRDNYKYLKWNYFDKGDTSFTLDAARQMLTKGKGNCYCYASVFFYLTRWIGYDAKIISGALVDGPHSWVEISGYIYDTQLEWRYYHDKGRTQYLWYFYHLSPSASKIRYIK